MKSSSTRRMIACLVVAAPALSLLSAATAGAEQLTPGNTGPTVSSPSFTMPGAQTAFEPDAGSSDELYVYNVTVGDAETINDLDTVSVCLHHSHHETGTAGEGSSTCTTTNPANAVKLTWTRSTDTFSLSAGSSTLWALGTAADVSTRSGALTDTTASLVFKFKISEAMREGTWTASVTATDISAATAADASQTKPVAAYSSITARAQKDFGTLGAGVAGTATDAPTVVSNGETTMSLTSGNFVNGTYSFALLTTGATSTGPAAGQVTYDCIRAASFTEASATRIGSTSTSVGSATASGTIEGGVAVQNSCRIKHGGGRPIVGAYAFTVINTIVNA